MIALSILLLLSQLADADNATSCYACVSPELKGRWFLTGLPEVSDSMYVHCPTQASQYFEPCSGPCMTLMFTDPDQQNPTDNNKLLFVRGCHQKLTKSIHHRQFNNKEKFCELDENYKMYSAGGNNNHVKMLFELCEGNLCNSRKTIEEEPCTDQVTNRLLNGAPLNCYDCLPSEGSNCHESTCNKKYCSRQQVSFNGGYQILKQCSDVNIFGDDNHCQTYEIVSNPGGIPVKSQYSQCYCKDNQYCNSAIQATSFFTIVISLFLL